MNNVPQQKDCCECRLRIDCKQVVVSDGDIRPCRLVVVGEAPGEHEDDEGRPFVGRSGKLLRKNFRRFAKITLGEDAIILNTVSCRPPENRKPRQDEIDMCRWWLRRNLAVIQPDIVVAAGKVPAEVFIKGKSVPGDFYDNDELRKDWRGGYYHFGVFAIWHPSFVIRVHRLDVIENYARQIIKLRKRLIRPKNSFPF